MPKEVPKIFLHFFFLFLDYDINRRLKLRLAPYLENKGKIKQRRDLSRHQRWLLGVSWSPFGREMIQRHLTKYPECGMF